MPLSPENISEFKCSNTHVVDLKRPVLIYITGRGYSGTTMLDAMLGNHEQIKGLGEIISGFSRIQHELCSCGLKFFSCPFWIEVVQQYKALSSPLEFEEFCNLSVKQAHLKNILNTSFYSRGHKLKNLSVATFIFTKAISIVSGKNYILDSTKEPTRALFINRFYENPSVIIHMVRNPVDVCASYYTKLSKGRPFKFLRKKFYPSKGTRFMPIIIAAISWTIGNCIIELCKLNGNKASIVVNYNKLIKEPENEIKKIENLLDLDLTQVMKIIKNGGEFEMGHTIGGNRFRINKTFTFDPSYSTQNYLPVWLKIFVKIVTYPIWIFYK